MKSCAKKEIVYESNTIDNSKGKIRDITIYYLYDNNYEYNITTSYMYYNIKPRTEIVVFKASNSRPSGLLEGLERHQCIRDRTPEQKLNDFRLK